MQIKVDDELILELTETQKKVIMNDINSDEFETDMKRRLKYVLTHKYEKCLERMKQEWCCDDGSGNCKLSKNGITEIPTDNEKLAELIMRQPDYKDRKAKEESVKQDIQDALI